MSYDAGFFKAKQNRREQIINQSKEGIFSADFSNELIRHFQSGGGIVHQHYGDLHELKQEIESHWNDDCGPNDIAKLIQNLIENHVSCELSINKCPA